MNETIKKVRKHMEKYEFHVVGLELYNFVWDDFCDWYIELSKFSKNESVLLYVLTNILKMLHPFMPFVTEEIYMKLPIHDESIMISSYPVYEKKFAFNTDMDLIIDLIKSVRRVKLENGIKEFTFVYDNEVIDNNIDLISKMLKLNDSHRGEYSSDLRNVVIPFMDSRVYLYYDGSVNDEKELESNIKERDRLIASILRRRKLLSNEGYVNKAPEAIVNKEREDLAREEHELEVINSKIKM